MKKIETILAENNVKATGLPKNIQSAIENSKKLYDEWQEKSGAITDESSEDESKEVEDLEEMITSFNESIEGAIEEFLKEEEEKNELKKSEPKVAETKKVEEKKVEVPVAAEPKKSGIGFGAFFLGAVLLVATAGAVNIMRNLE